MCVLSYFSRVWLFATLWTIAHQDPLSMEFSRQEHWSVLPCPSPGDFPNPGIETMSLSCPALAGRFFCFFCFFVFFLPLAPPGKPERLFLSLNLLKDRLWPSVSLGFPVAQLVKNLPAIRETWDTWVWSLGWECTLEKGKATHSSILAWRIPWTV